MKNKINKFLLIASILTVFTSCNDDDAFEGVKNAKPTLSVDQKSVSVTEGDVITFTVTIDKPTSNDVDYMVDLEGGSGSFRDFTSSGEETTISEGGFGQGQIGYKFVFPALATTATFTITTVKDVFVEGTETLRLRLRSSGNMGSYIAADSKTIDVTVADYVSNEFQINLEWAGNTTNIHGTIAPSEFFADNTATAAVERAAHEFCDLDMDLEVYDIDNNIIADSYNDCPESITLPASTPDGIYFIVPSYWSSNNFRSSAADRVQIPLKLTCAKPGVFVEEYDMTSIFNTRDGGVSQGNPEGYQTARILEKVGTTYTLKDIDENVLASGRYAAAINAIKNHKVSQRRK